MRRASELSERAVFAVFVVAFELITLACYVEKVAAEEPRGDEPSAETRAEPLAPLATSPARGAVEPPKSKWSALQRAQRARLAAAHADAARHRADRRPFESLRGPIERQGLRDYRAILHAHAADSAHTGGTLEEMVGDAKKEGVSIIFLSDHFRPPRDFMASGRGLRDGVLLIPGSESHGFLLHPDASILDSMTRPAEEIAEIAARGTGLVFLSHVEKRSDSPLGPLTGIEIYNRHADAEDDPAFLLALVSWLTDREKAREFADLVQKYPDEIFAAQVDYPEIYMKKWDAESRTRRVVGVGANDCHHNQVFVVKKVDADTVLLGTVVDRDDRMRRLTSELFPGISSLVDGFEPGAEVLRIDLDPYERSFRNLSTHVFASALDEAAVRGALRLGHAYVSHDWMCEPEGFFVWVERGGKSVAMLGDELSREDGDTLLVQLPLEATLCLRIDGSPVSVVTAIRHSFPIEGPGSHRLEAWLEIGGEQRPWIYANPILVR
jgi:hypothetical protein